MRMNNQLKLAAIAIIALIVLRVEAIGLGEIVIQSKLGQALNAKIGLIRQADDPIDAEEIKAFIANQNEHKKRSLDNSYAKEHVQLELQEDKSGGLILKLSSRLPIKEPIVNFLLDISWSTGHLIKEYALLLDPPNYVPATTSIAATTATTVLKHQVTTFPTKSYQAGHYGPVGEGETLFRIAFNHRPVGYGISLNKMMSAIFSHNPKAFAENNPEGLMKGSMLYIPTVKEILLVSELDVASLNKKEIVGTTVSAVAEETADEVIADEIITPIENIESNYLKTLRYLDLNKTSLSFSIEIGKLSDTTVHTKVASKPIELPLQERFSNNSLEYINQLTAEDIIEENNEIVIEEEFESENIAPVTEEFVFDEIDGEGLESNPNDGVINEAKTTAVETGIKGDELQTGVAHSESITSTSLIDNVVVTISPYLLPLAAMVVFLLALMLWLLNKRARQDASENVLYDSIEKAGNDKTEIISPTTEQDSVFDLEIADEEEAKTEQVEKTVEPEQSYVDTNEIKLDEVEMPEDTEKPSIIERSQQPVDASKNLEVDIPLEMEDTFSEADVVIDEEDYEDLLDITTDTADVNETGPEPQLELAKDEPLALDMDLFSGEINNDVDENSLEEDTEEKAFIKEVNVHMAYGDFDGAKDKIEQALTKEPDNIQYQLLMLNLLKTSGQMDPAQTLINELKKRADLTEEIKKELKALSSNLQNSPQTGFA